MVYNNINILQEYDEYRKEQSIHQLIPHYGELWGHQKIYNDNDC
jgi:hypothetical protein